MVCDDASIAAASPLAASFPSPLDAAAESLIVDWSDANDVCAPTPVPGVALSPNAFFIASTALANLGPAVDAVVEAVDKFNAGIGFCDVVGSCWTVAEGWFAASLEAWDVAADLAVVLGVLGVAGGRRGSAKDPLSFSPTALNTAVVPSLSLATPGTTPLPGAVT